MLIQSNLVACKIKWKKWLKNDWVQKPLKRLSKVVVQKNKLEENNEIVSRFSFQDLRDETALIKSLQFTRLIVDLSKEPNRYTQIAGISAGIPQINRVASEYVTHQENGYILKHLSDFEKGALPTYLGPVWNNWNRFP